MKYKVVSATEPKSAFITDLGLISLEFHEAHLGQIVGQYSGLPVDPVGYSTTAGLIGQPAEPEQPILQAIY